MLESINLSQEYQNIRDGVIKEMKDLINNKILIENPSWAKYLTTDKRDDISSKINSVLARIHSKTQSNAMGQSTYSKTGDYFKNHIYDAFFKRSPKNAIHEDLTFFMEVTLPEIREKELKKYQSESSEYRSKFYNDPEFLKSEDLNVMKHLIRTEVIERAISAREFDEELGLCEAETSIVDQSLAPDSNTHSKKPENNQSLKDSLPPMLIPLKDLLEFCQLIDENGHLNITLPAPLIGIMRAIELNSSRSINASNEEDSRRSFPIIPTPGLTKEEFFCQYFKWNRPEKSRIKTSKGDSSNNEANNFEELALTYINSLPKMKEKLPSNLQK